MESAQEIVESMGRAAPPGRESLTGEETARLRELTADLAAARPGAMAEYARFLAIGGRGLPLPERQLRNRLARARVLVTGGTGCIGSALMRHLANRGVRELASVSRLESGGWPRVGEAVYFMGDVRDRARVESIMDTFRPNVVFHCAAQRSPALAESEVHRTVSTNVLGARNVLEEARKARVRQVVIASTGKALRPYSPEVYTASKRAAEWLAAEAAGGGMLVSGARFTHVLDNSIVHARLLEQARAGSRGLMRLHSPHIAFYVQSALESARLLLLAYLGAERGEFRVHAIRDLGWPVSLLDVALGARGERSAPVYFSGYDPGYEESAFPGLYDPATAGDVSPLMNAFETAELAEPEEWEEAAGTDSFRLRMADSDLARDMLGVLERSCETPEREDVTRLFLDDLSWALLDATLEAADPRAVARSARLAGAHEWSMSPVHLRVTEALRARAGASGTLT